MFSVGVAPRRTREEERRRRIERLRQKIKKEKKTSLPFSQKPFQFPAPLFNILPAHLFHPRIHTLLYFMTISLTQRTNYIEGWKKNPFQDSYSSPPLWQSDPLILFWSPEIAPALEQACYLTQTYRWRFRRFLHRWRLSRLRKATTEDIVTGLAPKYPIWIVDWASKQKWVFEAQTLMKDITTRLYHHDGFFEDPQVPRNPYTNVPLTSSQLISVWIQLERAPIAQTAPFSALRTAKWNMRRFILEQSVPLQVHALRATMGNLESEDQKERLFDFIQQAYDHESIDCAKDSIWHCICRHPDYPLLQTWRRLCLKFYEADILFSQSDRLPVEQDKIWDRTVPLLEKQKEFRALRNMDLRTSVAARRAPTPPPQPVERIVFTFAFVGLE